MAALLPNRYFQGGHTIPGLVLLHYWGICGGAVLMLGRVLDRLLDLLVLARCRLLFPALPQTFRRSLVEVGALPMVRALEGGLTVCHMRLYYVSGETGGPLMGQGTAIHDNDLELVTGPQRIARLMGLRRKKMGWSHLELVERVEAGLPLSAVENLARSIDPHNPALRYEFLSRSTFARLRSATKPRLTRAASDRIYAVARVFAAVLDLWKGDEDAANRFLKRPNPLLDGRTPFDVAKESTAGADLVVEILGAARAGVAI